MIKMAPPERQIPRTCLLRLHPLLLLRVIVHLDEIDRKNLAKLDPRAAQILKHPEQKQSQRRTTKERLQQKQKERASTLMAPGVADPITLLARLNTRRLHKRIKYLKKNKPDIVTAAYPTDKATNEIAQQEWVDLLERAKKKADPLPYPSPYELLLFSPCPRPVTVLASYPRSGNSLLRNLFERATLRVTGSDMRGGLTAHDLVGEAAIQAQQVQFVKTHYPERIVPTAQFPCSRAVLLVRNPYDALESYFNLMTTNTHTTDLKEEMREKYVGVWEEMVLKEIQVWKRFHNYWLSQRIPVLLIRYEDLIRHPDQVLKKVVQFVLEIRDMTFFENRIQQCVSEDQIESLGSYKPRSGGIGKSLKRYSPDLLRTMNVSVTTLMHQLGYGECLATHPEKWKLDVIPGYGLELPNRSDGTLIMNSTVAVRDKSLQTDWRKLRIDMMGHSDTKCTCYRCTGGSKLPDLS
jgi:hypothetical protein